MRGVGGYRCVKERFFNQKFRFSMEWERVSQGVREGHSPGRGDGCVFVHTVGVQGAPVWLPAHFGPWLVVCGIAIRSRM